MSSPPHLASRTPLWRQRAATLVCAFVALAVGPAAAAPSAPQGQRGERPSEEEGRPTVPRELQLQIDRAIDRGVESLLVQQEVDGSWRHDIAGYGPGATGLIAYTLLKCGVPADHLAVRRAFEFMQRQPANQTYTVATVLMAMAARGDAKDKRWAEELAEKLLDWRQPKGWGYPGNRPDLSNTQFAGLGLRAADALGVNLKMKVWDQLAEVALDYLEDIRGTSYDPAGFFYERGGEHLATGSMTCAGLTLLSIAMEHVQGNKQAIIVAQKRAIVWLTKHFSVEYNPKPDSESGQHGWFEYYLYGIERVGSLMDLDRIGEHAWYELGARKLVGYQGAEGRWGNQADTSFALLFLARASGHTKAAASGAAAQRAPSERGIFGEDDPLAEVSLRASGTSELTLWVSSFGDRIHRMYAPDDAAKGPLPIKRVEYFIAEVGGGRPLESFARIDVDAEARPASQRFPVRHTPIGPAEYDVVANVTLTDFADGSDVVLESKPLRVKVGLTQDPEFLDYATDPDRNELSSLTFTVTSSSALDERDNVARNATDGLQATGWRAAPADTTPWLRLDFERPPRAGTLVLSPSLNPADLKPTPRPTRVRVTPNDDEKLTFEAPLDPNPRKKTRLALPRNLRLRSLRVDLLDPTAPSPGLNELELHPR